MVYGPIIVPPCSFV